MCVPSLEGIGLMIVKIYGVLDAVEAGSALIRVDEALVCAVLVPAYAEARLAGSVGQPVALHTLFYLEGQNQGATMMPRLAGFLTTEDRVFFELLTTCKGIGYRKALRAMTMTTGQIAAAIADRDIALLQTLPEIGRRTAETIVASLRGKVDLFVTTAAFDDDAVRVGAEDSRSWGGGVSGIARDALDVLLKLGENRAQATTWIDQALGDDEQPTDAQDLIARVYRIKAGH